MLDIGKWSEKGDQFLRSKTGNMEIEPKRGAKYYWREMPKIYLFKSTKNIYI